jgi:acetylornithine/N-succinyldiaminopimelate aminotransferase
MKQFNREAFDEWMVPNYNPAPVIPVKGKGSRVWDSEGKEYVDFAAGIAVNAVGHCHPDVVKALTEQAQRLWHVSNVFTNEPILALAERLVTHTFAEKVFFANSGGEANEAAFKLARKYAHDHFGESKSEIIAFDNAFHGRTLFTVSVGGQPKYTKGFEPLPGGIRHLPFNDVEALEAAVSDNTCAIVMEPVQGEGGIIPADPAFVRKARELADKHNALLVFDEVQTGMGRTGSLFAYQQFGIEPDILTSAKALGGGFPIGAMLTRASIAESFGIGSHGSTYGGNALAGAVGNAVFDIVNQPEVLEGVRAKGERLRELLQPLVDDFDMLDRPRGMGLMMGVPMSDAWQGRAREIMQAALAEGVMLLIAGPNTLRLVPSLLITEEDMVEGVARLRKALESLDAR